MSDQVTRLRTKLTERAITGQGTASPAARRTAFANAGADANAAQLIDQVARHAWKVTDEDVAAAKQAGLSEDQIFEIVVCAALGASTRQLVAALGVLDQALSETP